MNIRTKIEKIESTELLRDNVIINYKAVNGDCGVAVIPYEIMCRDIINPISITVCNELKRAQERSCALQGCVTIIS